MINKADSVEAKEDMQESRESLQQQPLATTIELPCDEEQNDIVIEEASKVPSERNPTMSRSEQRKSMEQEVSIEQQKPPPPRPSSSSITSLPASISTQTLPTEDFPEASTVINQSSDASNVTTIAIETQHEIQRQQQQGGSEDKSLLESASNDKRSKGIRKTKTRSSEERESRKSACDIESNRSVEVEIDDNFVEQRPSSFDEQQRGASKQSSLTYQQSQASQDEDYEVAMVSGLLPGCVGRCLE